MNRYHLTHVTEFQYDGRVSESYNEVRLRPIHDDKQSCVSFRLITTPRSRVTAYQDAFGNWVHQFNIFAEHHRLTVESESVVLAHEVPCNDALSMSLSDFDARGKELCEEYFDFIAATTYVPHLTQLQEMVDAAIQASDGTVLGFIQASSDLVHHRLRYVKGATHVHSSIADSLSLCAGVCQDFAHVMLGLVRTRGLPARYVSGYLVPQPKDGGEGNLEEVVGGQASHAWTEVFIPDMGWLGFDPTLGKPAGLRHVRLAYGRDYGDVPPVRGVYKGQAGQRLSVDVRVRPVVDGEGQEYLQNTAAMPMEESIHQRPQQPQQQQQ
jgi:transglutaminase-like putative cysteine protease